MNIYSNIEYLDISRKEEIESFLTEWYAPSPNVTVKTSGSTGQAKNISLQKKHMIKSAQKTIDFLQLEKGSICYLCLSCSTIAGKMMIVRALINEMKILVGPVSSGTLEMLDRRIEFAAIVPLQLQHILFHLPEKLRLINKVIVGGAPVNETIEQELKRENLTIFQTFGMTETISHVALRKIGAQPEDVYHSLQGVTFSTDDQQRLIIHYPEIEIHELATNDLVEINTERSFKWLGRADFAINSGGIKIIPEVLEAKLSTFISEPFFIFSLPDEKLGEQVALLIEGETIDPTTYNFDHLLDKYEKPRSFFFLPKFIRTESGKINRPETIKLLAS